MTLNLILGFIIGASAVVAVFLLLKDRLFGHAGNLENKLNEMFPKILQSANEQLVSMLDAKKETIETDLKNKKSAIEELVKNLKTEIEKSNKRVEEAEKERIDSFSALKEALEGHKKITEQLSVTTDGLRKVLSNNQLRGQFGEQVAEELLQMAGFVNGTDYLYNKQQEGSKTRPDFTIFLPDGVKINVDAKFPYSNLQKLINAESKESKKLLFKAFEQDVKNKVKQVTSRDYINPEDNTVDFVIMFIPNEMIFSFIYDKMNHVWTDAIRKKVILAGPFNFTATLRLIRQSYSNFKYQNNVRQIITFIKDFEKEFGKYNEEFVKIGDRIVSLQKQYHVVSTTRTNQLTKTIEKIKIGEEQASEALPEPS